jgi:homoserine kinase
MRFSAAPVEVRVPATSANLGPGFDSFGLALARYDQVRASVTGAGLSIEVSGAGADQVPRGEDHLVLRAMRATFERLGGQPAGLALDCRNQIPHGRGLGSSAAAIISGIELARGLSIDGRTRLSDQDALALATELEGHPDNVSACLLGGLCIAWTAAGRGQGVRAAGPEQVRDAGVLAVLFIPDDQSATSVARSLLPAAVPHADAAFNAGRAGLLVVALTGRPELLLAATEDRLHQNYRAASMPASAGLVELLRERGIAAVLSGAGSAVLALVTAEQVAAATELGPAGWECVELPIAGGASSSRL